MTIVHLHRFRINVGTHIIHDTVLEGFACHCETRVDYINLSGSMGHPILKCLNHLQIIEKKEGNILHPRGLMITLLLCRLYSFPKWKSDWINWLSHFYETGSWQNGIEPVELTWLHCQWWWTAIIFWIELRAAKMHLLRSLSLLYQKKGWQAGPHQSFFWSDTDCRFVIGSLQWTLKYFRTFWNS